VCERLGVPHYVLDLEDRFGHDVVRDFVDEYARGRTPIPCVRCNTFTKFRDLLRTADLVDAEWVATGHYARAAGGALLRGRDPSKDQTYFLWGVDRRVVRRMLLPVGELTKAETRAVARRMGLAVVADKVESQDICFVPDGDHTKVIRRTLGAEAPALARGPFVTLDGRVVGEHGGHARFTVGQRRGLPGGLRRADVRRRHPTGRARGGDRPARRAARPRRRGAGGQLAGRSAAVGREVGVQVRHRARAVPAVLVRADHDAVELALAEPVAAITPGQSLVLYEGDRLLGGGVIEAALGQRAPLPLMA
jgi:tRNA-specific 2-thiouridylase